MIHENFYAKYYVVKNPNPMAEDSINILRVSFYHNKTKVGQAYIGDFDTPESLLFNFKIYKKYRRHKYGSDAMEYMMNHFNLKYLSVGKYNERAKYLYFKHNFEIYIEYIEPSDGLPYIWMIHE